jgi:hypothetical protein
MNVLVRAANVLGDPAAAWQRIEKEPTDAVFLLSGYCAVLALVPALASFVGVSLIGMVELPGEVTRVPIVDGLFSAIFGYVATFVIVLVVALLIEALAPLFGARRHFTGAIKLAAYSFTPVWLAGIFLLLPGLYFLLLVSLYGGYILVKGLPLLMKAPAPQSYYYAATIVACAAILVLLTAWAQQILFGVV